MRLLYILVFLIQLTSLKSFSQEINRLLRFPTISKTDIVFTYSGDLFIVNKDGGIARKITSHEGMEIFPKFSPDGKTISFTGQYDGNTEVYIIPANGGEPKRLTYTAALSRDDISDRMGPNNIVFGWKDNETVVYRSRNKSFNSFIGNLNLVSINGSLPEELPLPTGGFCCYSKDKNKIAYNKVFREFRTWKYYRGGMADDVCIYDFKTKSIENITNNPAQDIIPMWHENNVYYISDRDRTMNLFVYNLDTKETKKLTKFTEFDIKFPSLGDDEIVFENGGFIYVFDLKTEEYKKIPITIIDDNVSSRNKIVDAGKNINTIDISPKGNRVVIGARGDVFTVPKKSGITRNLTKTSGVHDRNSVWSPDGKYIAYISDATGEDEIYIINQDGSEEPKKITKGSTTYKYSLVWSPDSKKILWGDKNNILQYVDIESLKVTQVDKSDLWEIRSYSWSPDSKWVTYDKYVKNNINQIYIYNLENKKTLPVTEEWYSSSQPTFSADGKYLYFTSERDFKPVYSWTEWNHAYIDMSKIYMAILSENTPSPFQAKSDEIETINDEESSEENENNDVIIDFDDINKRIISLPVSSSRYWSLTSYDNGIVYVKKTHNKGKQIMCFDINSKKETEIGKYSGYMLTSDRKNILINQKGKYYIEKFSGTPVKIGNAIDLSNLSVIVNKKEEWQQIFNECWRQMRDFFYDPNMHGVDWLAIKEKYQPLVKYVNHRADLNYIIGEMIGELNIGHAYIGGGDIDKPKRIKLGLLGAVIEKDESGYFKIIDVLDGQNWRKEYVSPLKSIGVDVNEGDFILEINGVKTNSVDNIYSLLTGYAGKQTEIIVSDKPSFENSRKEIVIPIAEENSLYYYKWIQDNIRKVDSMSNGQIGYIHIPDMMQHGLNLFAEYYYPQINKKALIIDDRHNGGGNVSPMIIERLSRKYQLAKMARNSKQYISPGETHVGPKVCLVNEYSASDGDLFAYRFRELGLGTIIGTRTWGGVVGIRGSLPLIDGGSLNKPEFAHYAKDGSKWIIEGEGVSPDIEVVNNPAKEYNSIDEQLNKAVELLLKELEEGEFTIPEIPEFPDKSK